MDVSVKEQIEELRMKVVISRMEADLKKPEIEKAQEARILTQKAIEDIHAEYAERLREAERARSEARDKVLAETRALQELNAQTIEYDKQLSKLIESQNDLERSAELVDEISKLVGDFEAWGKAHPYQIEDIVATITAYRNGKGGMLNANDMSLGKTFETIVTLYILELLFIKENGRTPRILWLTKKTLVTSTPKEFKRWHPKRIIWPVISNKLDERTFQVEFALDMGGIVITNYESVGTTPLIANMTWDFVILDEVHKLKGGANYKPTRIFTQVLEVTKKSRFQIMLSGTPMVNRVEEMWAYLHIFHPEKFPSFREFQRAYGAAKIMSKGMEISIDVDKLLRGALKGQMIRRTKGEVGLQLPSLTIEEVTLNMNNEQAEVYRTMRDHFFLWLDDTGDKKHTTTAIIAQLIRLRQINVWPAGVKVTSDDGTVTQLDVRDSSKIDECMDKIEELHDAGEQFVVFSNFNDPLFEVRDRCEKLGISVGVISGATTNLVSHYEEEFQQGRISVLCLNMAMGEGLNLHKDETKWPGGASYGGILDKWYSPARNEQCISRIHRQGCKEPVTIFYWRNDNSIDLFIEDLVAEKAASFAGIEDSEMIRPSGDWRNYLKEKL